MRISDNSDIAELLKGCPGIADLYTAWRARRPVRVAEIPAAVTSALDQIAQIPWLEDIRLARQFIAHAIRNQEFLLVLDAAPEILSASASEDGNCKADLIGIRMDYAKALTRLGVFEKAREQIALCTDPDTELPLKPVLRAAIHLLRGDIFREEWHAATDEGTQVTAAREALRSYNSAHQLDPHDLQALSSCASTAFLLRNHDVTFERQAQQTASHILELTANLEASRGAVHRMLPRASALAILGHKDEAFAAFGELQSFEDATTADLAEARFHAELLAEALALPRDYFKPAFPPLQLVVFAGHSTDLPGAPPRFPLTAIDEVKREIENKLHQIQARVGLVSAAAGGDLLFTEAMLKRNGTLHLVLPWSQEEFRHTSVLPYEPTAAPPIWAPLFEQALKSAATVREIGHLYNPSSGVGWDFAMNVTAGIAFLIARALRLEIQPIALWDGRPGRGAGGTESFYALWKELSREPIHLQSLCSKTLGAWSPAVPSRHQELHQEVKTMLFADIAGYSKLKENAIPHFTRLFLSGLGQLIATTKHIPQTVDTWGDAIYAVFNSPQDAGWFALEVIQLIEDGYNSENWLAQGLYWESRSDSGEPIRNRINIRIGLHTGPVTMHADPVVRRLSYTGAHVTRAARIEPLAKPGQVFASEEFAAMTELLNHQGRAGGPTAASNSELRFAVDYAGSSQLAKAYPGRYRLYRVSARREFEIERLAEAVHQDYCEKARERGETPDQNPSMLPWDQIPEDLRDANRAQAADIPNKLRLLGFELTAIGGSPAMELRISGEQVEALAAREHIRWMRERQANGWTYGKPRDNKLKRHPLLVPWEELDEEHREKDRDVIRALPQRIHDANYRVKPVYRSGQL
jgi:class 3 adenylate cyclase